MRTKTNLDVDTRPNLAPLSIAIVYATHGRPEILERTFECSVLRQTRKPELVLISCQTPEDAGDLGSHPSVEVLLSKPGLTAQRNTALRAMPTYIDIVVFFDDDFVAHPHWLEEASKVFAQNPDIAGLTGKIIKDGIRGPGIAFAEALEIVSSMVAVPKASVEPFTPYGCNMAFRRAAIENLAFDERLVLYAWQEDRDFGSQISQRGGRTVKLSSALGVHLGVKAGRVSGKRLGYSQISNPVYLWNKGTMPLTSALAHMVGNVTMNFLRAFRPEEYVDRRGRLYGNIAAMRDLLKGKLDPVRAKDF